MKKYKIMIIHLSHTDIGYKDTQAKIKSLQVKNLYEIVKKIKHHNEFSWNIECFGVLFDFLEEYPDLEDELVNLIKNKKIGISTNFWNYTKIASPFLINRAFLVVKKFVKKNKLEKYSKSLITNDINGYSKEWAVKAYDNGTRNFYFGLHWSHGYFPNWKKQEPFYWRLNKDKKVLVWIGDQYAVGNNFGIVPGPISDYISSDQKTAGFSEKDQIKLANERMKDLIYHLEKDKYKFRTIPLTVLGMGSDNDPINYEILERVKLLEKEWKKIGIDSVSISTLQEFFDEINKENVQDISILDGEWPDWWADGAASNPFALKAFKESQRSYETFLRIGGEVSRNVENNLLLYSEHTYGTEWSTFKPYSFYNKQTEELKKTFSLKALEETKYLLDKKLEYSSSKVLNDNIIQIELVNPTRSSIFKRINLKRFLGVFEHSNFFSKDVKILDNSNNSINFSIQITEHPRKKEWSEKDIVIHAFFKPNEEKRLTINFSKSLNKSKKIADQYETKYGDMPDDIINIMKDNNKISYYNGELNSKYVNIFFNEEGIKKFIYQNKNIFTKKSFIPVKYIDKQENDYFVQYNKREESGRNIITNSSKRFFGKYLKHNVKISDDKENAEVFIYYELEGCQFLRVRYEISNHDPLVLIYVEVLNNPSWSNETFFMSMPFFEYELEYGSLYKVNQGQLKGSLLNYHTINEGIVYKDFKINFLDSSLVYTGPIIYSQKRLAHDPKVNNDIYKEHYAILTTNNWNTNFSLDQGGFHEFRFILSPIKDKKNVVEELFGQSIEIPIKRKKHKIL